MYALINTIERSGYQDGDVIARHPDDWKPGTQETPGKGFIAVQIVGKSPHEMDALVNPKKTTNPDWLLASPEHQSGIDPEIKIGERSRYIDHASTPIPLHPMARRSAKTSSLAAGLSISRHLELGRRLPVREYQLVMGNR